MELIDWVNIGLLGVLTTMAACIALAIKIDELQERIKEIERK